LFGVKFFLLPRILLLTFLGTNLALADGGRPTPTPTPLSDLAVTRFRGITVLSITVSFSYEIDDTLESAAPNYEVWIKNVGKAPSPSDQTVTITTLHRASVGTVTFPLYSEKWKIPSIKPGQTRKFLVTSWHNKHALQNPSYVEKLWHKADSTLFRAEVKPHPASSDATKSNNALTVVGKTLRLSPTTIETAAGYKIIE